MRVKDKRIPGFFIVDNVIVDKFGPLIGAIGVAIYTALAKCAGDQKVAFPSHSWIADKLGIHPRSVIRYVRQLEALQLIAVQRDRMVMGKRRNLYILLDLERYKGPPATPATPASDSQSPGANVPYVTVGHSGESGVVTQSPVCGDSGSHEEDPGKKTHGEGADPSPVPDPAGPPETPLATSQASQLASVWLTLTTLRNGGGPLEDQAEIEAHFGEYLRQGADPARLEALIMDPTRDRTEWFSSYRKRAKAHVAARRANATRAQRAQTTRVTSQTENSEDSAPADFAATWKELRSRHGGL